MDGRVDGSGAPRGSAGDVAGSGVIHRAPVLSMVVISDPSLSLPVRLWWREGMHHVGGGGSGLKALGPAYRRRVRLVIYFAEGDPLWATRHTG